MVVGLLRIRLYMRGNQSLKEKRNILKRIKDRVHNEFNVSIAEVDENESWQTGALGIAAVGNDSKTISGALDKIIQFIESMYLAEIIQKEVEILHE